MAEKGIQIGSGVIIVAGLAALAYALYKGWIKLPNISGAVKDALVDTLPKSVGLPGGTETFDIVTKKLPDVMVPAITQIIPGRALDVLGTLDLPKVPDYEMAKAITQDIPRGALIGLGLIPPPKGIVYTGTHKTIETVIAEKVAMIPPKPFVEEKGTEAAAVEFIRSMPGFKSLPGIGGF